MTIIITAFERSPDGGKGLARDYGACLSSLKSSQAQDVEKSQFNFPVIYSAKLCEIETL